MLLDLDLSIWKPHLRLRREQNKVQVWDPIRKKYLILQPEELVRQLLIQYLLLDRGYSLYRIKTEQLIYVAGRSRRFDLLMLDAQLNPYLLIECKAPDIPLNQSVLDQAAAYNYALRAPYLLVCNGLQAYSCHIDFDNRQVNFLTEAPFP